MPISKCRAGRPAGVVPILLAALGLLAVAGAGTGCRTTGKISDRSPAAEPGLELDHSVRFQAANHLIEAHAFSVLSPEHQALISRAGEAPLAAPIAAAPSADSPWAMHQPLGEDDYRVVSRWVSRPLWDRMAPVHQHAIVSMITRRAAGEEVPALCFTPGTDPELVDVFNQAVHGRFGVRFNAASRWSSTATPQGPLTQGQPTVLTYSFPPDGTDCPTLSAARQPSNLFAYLNGIYGSSAVWQPIYAQVFARWGELCGLSYVFEANDDGAPIGGGSPGSLGVRGDMRLSGTGLDGPSNVLAFNYYPNTGDMVIDTADTFYTSTAANSLRLRNVLAHEHGHGVGMAHVCPTNQTKLMEPFISLAYDGPQTDDTLLGQRLYGDPNEPNDSPAAATPLAAPTALNTTVRLVSSDDRADTDWYALTAPAAGLLVATVRPIGGAYLSGTQNGDGSCSAGITFSAGSVNALTIAVLAADSSTVLASTTAPAGSPATASAVLAAGQTFYLRITPGPAGNIQAYELDYRTQPGPLVYIALPEGSPTTVSPTGSTRFSVSIQTVGDTLAPDSAVLLYRFGTAQPFQSAPLVLRSGDIYDAFIPPSPCGSTVQYYIQVTGQATDLQTFPAAAPGTGGSAAFAAVPNVTTVLFQDSFETDTGWTAGAPGDTAASGVWFRGNPNGSTSNGASVQPEDDHSDPGTQCFFTGQAAPGAQAGSNDVDSGRTTLVSPIIDCQGVLSPVLSYYRWYSNNGGGAPNTDVFTVEASADGGATWVNLETVGPATQNSGGWLRSEIFLATRITPTAAVRLRIIAEDAGEGSLVEAAIDDVVISSTTCVAGCRADFNRDGSQTAQDLFDFLGAYFTNDFLADFNNDRFITVQDIFDFLAAFFEPCP